MGGNRSHRIMERGGGGSTLGDRLWNGMVWYGMVMLVVVLRRPLPCWVRSHGRSKTLIKSFSFCVLWEGDRTGCFCSPGSPHFWLLLLMRSRTLLLLPRRLLFSVTWIKTLRNGILDELLFDLLLFVPISEVLLNFLNPAAPSLRIDGEREKWRPTCDLLPLNHCAASSSQYGERRLVDLPDAWRLADMTNTSASFICSWFFDAWPYLTVRPSPTNY
ncbi:uncharacterized protein LOC109721581 isoform X3 [Ananas comosus]|uniref:Uncharacterized protein LOC109721581 isoform X3 n=1 Tax=Ananas comosus TaxID=4615 RepID=A0A6P5GAK3_ANACO|nr:uncharacterized protein LOC109721581 isoform X3 [Ananas comosus]